MLSRSQCRELIGRQINWSKGPAEIRAYDGYWFSLLRADGKEIWLKEPDVVRYLIGTPPDGIKNLYEIKYDKKYEKPKPVIKSINVTVYEA